jgi:cytochrome b561
LRQAQRAAHVPAVRLTNTHHAYGMPAIVLHWLMAVLLIALIALGIFMVRLPDAGFDTRKITAILIHKEIGLVAFLFAGVRLAWRQLNPLPRPVESVPEWQQVAGLFVHLCFYALMLAQPITGWVMSSASGIPVDFLGLFTLPDLVAHNEDLFAQLRQVHDWLGIALAGLVSLHALAALRHHFGLRDVTLRRMLGEGLPGAP